MKKHKNRFKFEVHLGLLVIVFILLCLNFTSNLIIFRARESKRSTITMELNSAALAVSRDVQGMLLPSLTESQKHNFMLQHKLSGLMVISSKPPDNTAESKKRWFQSIACNLPPGQIPELAQKLLASEFQTLTRGDNNEYFYVYPIPTGRKKSLIILSKNVPELAFLDDSGRVILISAIVSIVAIVGMYLLLTRFIFAPFRKIKKEALNAGRAVDQSEDNVEAMVEDYRKIIEELKEKETQLLELNKKIQRKADSLEQFNQYLLTSMSSGIVTVDRGGRIMSINRAAAAMFGVDPAPYVGKSYVELFKTNRKLIQDVQYAITEGNNPDYREIDFTSDVGKSRILGVSVSTISDYTQQPIGVSILINDLTELKRLQSELETRNRLAALGEMAGGLAHQLRNSMGAVSGYCNLLRKRLSKQEVDMESLNALVQEVAETEKLVERFLQFAKPLAFAPRPVAVKDMIQQIIDAFQARADCRQVNFVFRQAYEVTIAVDPLLMKQALTNIIENAVNAYEGKDGLVEIRVAVDSTPTASRGVPIVQLEVEDSGCGIAEEDMDKIFTPFYSSRPSGTGLGLPLARKIIDLHQGSLSVRSQLGKGTTFTISLPLQPVPSPQPVI
ncbi:MAG: PAS domain-containing sensor histidine kinase [Candidatus Zixiibacteriota bacterium]